APFRGSVQQRGRPGAGDHAAGGQQPASPRPRAAPGHPQGCPGPTGPRGPPPDVKGTGNFATVLHASDSDGGGEATTMSKLDSQSDSILGQLVEEFLARRRAGERPSATEYIDRHPELAGRIREIFPALGLVEAIKPGSGEATLSVPRAE